MFEQNVFTYKCQLIRGDQMVAYCNKCQRYVNQSCEKCGATYGIDICEWYACGGRMICPTCGGNDLVAKKKFEADPYDFSKQKDRPSPKRGRTDLEAKYFAEQRAKKEMQGEKAGPSEKMQDSCSLCGFAIIETWKFCPECGASLIKK
jgi:hypothetical protein